jgi:hypothetical protein
LLDGSEHWNAELLWSVVAFLLITCLQQTDKILRIYLSLRLDICILNTVTHTLLAVDVFVHGC